jgi:osmoprotectant transport system permease protein
VRVRRCFRLASLVLGSGLLLLTPANAEERGAIQVGSKKFTESVILGEALAHLVRESGREAVHRAELGGTRILWNALLRGEIDAYPEYTGTIRQEILAGRLEGRSLSEALATHDIRMSQPLGFNNTYAVGVRRELADSLGLERISDLARHPELSLGFTSEFMDRADGWPGLRDRYRLAHRNVRGLDHDLAYRGLVSGSIHAIDLYSTDAEIRYYDLRVLEGDLGYFPAYPAVILYRNDLHERASEVVRALRRLEGGVPEAAMVALNARAKLDRVAESQVAADFLSEALAMSVEVREETWYSRLLVHTREHLILVGISLLGAILFAVPLGILAAKRPRLGQGILGVTGIVQTIPSLAILVFMIPLLGIGPAPAIVAMFLYSLLPIVRNTYAGLNDISLEIRESAQALGLPSPARLRLVELPMASRSILAGIKTAAVINVGTATLAALIGAGGYGQPIFTGIRLDDAGLILQGAVPAALLALAVQGTFEIAERWIVPEGLRIQEAV